MPRFREPSTREINWVASAVATVARLLTALAACKQMQATLCPAWPGPRVPNVQGHTRARTRRACSEGPENGRRARVGEGMRAARQVCTRTAHKTPSKLAQGRASIHLRARCGDPCAQILPA